MVEREWAHAGTGRIIAVMYCRDRSLTPPSTLSLV